VSISLTFQKQLLRPYIPKAQKDTDDMTVFFRHLGSGCVKAACKTLMKLTPSVNFINILIVFGTSKF